MARQVRRGAWGMLALAATLSSALAQTATPDPSTPASTPPKAGWRPLWGAGRIGPGGQDSPAFENVRKALENLTPEQRKRFQENFLRWANLSPEEKKALRDREEVRKKFMEEEVQAAIQESGLQLDGDRREQFVKRYGEERRLIEEQLRQQMNEKRKPLVHELISRLRTEFAASSDSTPAPAPPQQTIQTASPAPTAKP